MREHGMGTIQHLPSKKFRARLPGREGRFLAARATRAEAEADLALAVLDHRRHAPTPQGTPLAAFGRQVLERREVDGYSNARRELSRWATHVERTELQRSTVEGLTRVEVLDWLRARSQARAQRGRGHATHRARPLSRSVVIDALRILRAVLREAVLRGLRADDPTTGVKVARSRGHTREPWTWLRAEEVRRLLEVADVHPEDHRAAHVALTTGLREGELWCLHLRDVDLTTGRLVVRYGGRRGTKLQPTKGRRPRVLQLLPPALEALREQIESVTAPGRRNPLGLVFPSLSRGRPTYRAEGHPPRCWGAWLRAAGLAPDQRPEEAPITWHSLRHTFATLVLAGRLPGAEGEGWRLERVSAYLGHTSIAVTQRYADVAALL